MKTAIRSALILALSLASTLAAAGGAPAETNPSSVRVSLSDLNLSSNEGQSTARDRIHQAARIACARSMDPYNLAPHYEDVSCIASSEQRAVQQLQVSALVAKK
jgi:UrcA family protein